MDVVEMDKCIRMLVHQLLCIGDDQLAHFRDKPIISPVSGKPLLNYHPFRFNSYIRSDRILEHELQINAVMLAIKPGLFNICFRKYSKEIVMKYLLKIKNKSASIDLDSLSPAKTPKEKEKSSKSKNAKRTLPKVKPVVHDEFKSKSSSVLVESSSSVDVEKQASWQNLSNYICLAPMDQEQLITQYRTKYFE